MKTYPNICLTNLPPKIHRKEGKKMKFKHFAFAIDKRFPYYPNKAEHIGINLTSLEAPFDDCVRATESYHMRARLCGLG